MPTRLRTRSAWVGVFAAVLAGGATACSLVSGWSDLESGAAGGPGTGFGRDGGDASASTGGRVDASTGGSSGSGASPGETDAGVAEGGGPDAETLIYCNGDHCPATQGCCVSPLFTTTCSAQGACSSLPNSYLSCTDSRACAAQLGGVGQCCASKVSLPSSACQSACNSGQEEICDPTDPSSCLSGVCTAKKGFQGVYSCQ